MQTVNLCVLICVCVLGMHNGRFVHFLFGTSRPSSMCNAFLSCFILSEYRSDITDLMQLTWPASCTSVIILAVILCATRRHSLECVPPVVASSMGHQTFDISTCDEGPWNAAVTRSIVGWYVPDSLWEIFVSSSKSRLLLFCGTGNQ